MLAGILATASRAARTYRLLAFVVALCLVVALPARAQADEVRALLQAPAGDWTVGDVIPLSLQVRHPAGWRVIVPPLGSTWGAFEVRSQSLPQIRDNNDGTETTSQQIEVAVFAPGDHTTPAVEISLVNSGGRVTPYVVPPSTVTLRSVLNGDDTVLRDIKPQWALSVPNALLVYLQEYWPLFVGLLLVAFLAGTATTRVLQRRRVVVDTRTPYQRAYDDLIELETSGLLGEANYKEHYAHVAAALRQLIEDIYNFPATECTTTEMRRALRGLNISEEQARYALALLQECDIVKFADVWPEGDDARTIAARARQWIVMVDPTLMVARGVQTEYVA